MKVAMIGLRGIPAKSGGVEVVVENLSVELVRLGADVTVYCRTPYCKERPKEYKGVKLRYLTTINTKNTEAFVHTFLSTFDAIFKDYDIIHYHAMGNALFSFFPRLFGKKTIVTLHGLDYEREKWGAAAKTYLRLCEKAALSSNKVVSVSEKIKKHYHDKYKKDIEYLPNGVSIEKTKTISALKRFNIKSGYILFLSRLVPEKGLHFLIDAYRQAKTDKQLVIAGDHTHTESYFKEVKELAKDDKNIIFTGPLYGDDKIEAFSNASFFVLPSTIEGMPIVLLESMSFGLCPLVSDIAENMDTMKGNGYSFKSKDTDDLKDKIIYMINHPKEIKERGIKAKAYVEKEFNWQAISKKQLEIYEKVLKK
jgi:glycosyltransferase involved in cell wall biosynthesis